MMLLLSDVTGPPRIERGRVVRDDQASQAGSTIMTQLDLVTSRRFAHAMDKISKSPVLYCAGRPRLGPRSQMHERVRRWWRRSLRRLVARSSGRRPRPPPRHGRRDCTASCRLYESSVGVLIFPAVLHQSAPSARTLSVLRTPDPSPPVSASTHIDAALSPSACAFTRAPALVDVIGAFLTAKETVLEVWACAVRSSACWSLALLRCIDKLVRARPAAARASWRWRASTWRAGSLTCC